LTLQKLAAEYTASRSQQCPNEYAHFFLRAFICSTEGKSAIRSDLTFSQMRSKIAVGVQSSVKSAGNVLGNEKMSKSNQRQRSGSGHVDTRKLFLVLRSRGVAVSGSKREITSSRWRQN
jgi:hypothetical protein